MNAGAGRRPGQATEPRGEQLPADGAAPRVPDALVLVVAVLCVSSSAILIRWCDSSAASIAFWRLALAAAALLAVGSRHARGRGDIVRALRSPWCLAAGVFLALHFVLWIRSLSETSVAASTFLLAIQVPVAGLLSWVWLKEPPRGRGLAGMALALAGILAWWAWDRATHGAGSSVARGDLLAIGAGLAHVGYVGVGRRVRRRVRIVPYLGAVYAWAALAVAASTLPLGATLAPAGAADWGLLVALALVPTLGGHGLFNYALARVRVYVVNLAVMGEPVVASILAWLLLAEAPPMPTWIAGPLILAGATLALHERVGPRR